MACRICNHKGYLETQVMRDAKVSSVIAQCLHCNDIKAYSKRVQEVLGITPETVKAAKESNVIPFPIRRSFE